MQCLLCGKKISRLRYWKLKSEFCSEEHAETHKRQTLDRLMQSQEEILSRASPPLSHLHDDSGPVAPAFEPRLSEPPAPQPTSFDDTRPRIDRSHQLPAASIDALREQAAESFEGLPPPRGDEAPGGDLNDPLQRLMEATASKPIADEPHVKEPAGPEAREAEPLGEETEAPVSELSSERDPVLHGLIGVGDPHLTPSDPVEVNQQNEGAFESREVSPQPVDLAPLESVEADLNDALRSRMERTTAEPVFPELEVRAPIESTGDHDAIVARLMGATAEERPALSDLLEGVDEEQADDAEFADPLEQDALKPTEVSSPPSAPGPELSLQELLDGLDAAPQSPEAPKPPQAPEDTVPANETDERVATLSDELMPLPPPAERIWDEARQGSRGSAELTETWEMHHEPAGAKAPSVALSVPNFEAGPARHVGSWGLISPISAAPDFIEVGEAAGGSWQPGGFSSSPLTPSGTVALPDSGIIAASSTNAAYALRVADWVSIQSRTVSFGFDDVCEVAPIGVGEGLFAPAAECQVPGFRLDPVSSDDRYQEFKLFGLLSRVSPQTAEGEPSVLPHAEDIIAASWECRAPQARIEEHAGENRYRGIVLAEMISWVNPNTIGQHGLPVFANWTGAAEQPRSNIEVPVVLLTGAIRSVRQFPRFGYLLKSATGGALMQGLQSGDASGILPVLALNEQANQPQPFSVMEMESQEMELEAIGPAAAVYAPADLDPREYA